MPALSMIAEPLEVALDAREPGVALRGRADRSDERKCVRRGRGFDAGLEVGERRGRGGKVRVCRHRCGDGPRVVDSAVVASRDLEGDEGALHGALLGARALEGSY
jgi:hypothetical protein